MKPGKQRFAEVAALNRLPVNQAALQKVRAAGAGADPSDLGLVQLLWLSLAPEEEGGLGEEVEPRLRDLLSRLSEGSPKSALQLLAPDPESQKDLQESLENLTPRQGAALLWENLSQLEAGPVGQLR